MNETLNRLLSQPEELPADAATLLHRLGWPTKRRAELDGLLGELEDEGVLVRIKGDRYVRPADAGMVTGRIRVNRQGKGRLVPDQPGATEVMIPEPETGTALNEDRVLVVLDPAGSTGSVVRVLQRRRTRFVGTLHRGSGVLRVIPDDPRIPHEFYVPEPRGSGGVGKAGPGDKVVVELRLWESRRANPEGEVVEVLGRPEEQGVDMLSVLRQYALEGRFPDAVDQEARRFGSRVSERDLVGRLDCRRHRVVTIDPDDAKDFDDAICVEKESEGGWRLWVHVADVAHYVRPGSALDQEARERGNSTYLVDRVIPMLPEALSNELCSLKPGVDRLTQCVEFRLDKDGRVRKAQFHRAVIHSKRRYTYAQALEILKDEPRDDFEDMLHDAHQLAQILRKARFNHGALELGSSEIKIRLDAHGRVSRLEKHSDDESHQLIEEFMLLANEAVATHLESLERTALHRVHEEPDPRRLAEYRQQVRALGIDCGDLRRRVEMRRLTERIKQHPAGQALRIGLLRSLPRARYDVVPGGHFGLAKRHYTHFTSPIRRYADLVIHRALAEGSVGDEEELGLLARHLSDTERNSSDAERDSREIKLFTFLEAQLHSRKPAVYQGIVADVSPSGFFVDVPDLSIGGMVPVSSLGDDFYVLDGARRRWVGRRTRRVFAVGDPIEVRVRKVDMASRRVDFELPGSVARGSRPSPVRRGAVPPSAKPASRSSDRPPVSAGRPQARPPARLPAPAQTRPPARSSPRPVQRPAPRPAPRPASSDRVHESRRAVPPSAASRPVIRTSASSRGPGSIPPAPASRVRPPARSGTGATIPGGPVRPTIATSGSRTPLPTRSVSRDPQPGPRRDPNPVSAEVSRTQPRPAPVRRDERVRSPRPSPRPGEEKRGSPEVRREPSRTSPATPSRDRGNRPVENRPVQNRPGQNRPVQNRPVQGRPVENRPAADSHPSRREPGAPRSTPAPRSRGSAPAQRAANPFDGPPRPIPVPVRPVTEPDASDWSPGSRGGSGPGPRAGSRPGGSGQPNQGGRRDGGRPRR